MLKQLELKYFLRDKNGALIENTPEDMFHRVAKAIASVEKSEDYRQTIEQEFFNMMNDRIFMPNSPTLMNAGTEMESLAACFLVDMEDSMDGIMTTLHDSAKIFASGGGVGVPFSKLRANGDLISTTKGTSTGPVSFAHMFDAMVDTVKQGGRRRGAMMATLSVDHPDVLEFIEIKRNKTRLNNMNLSVMLTDEFMNAVQNNEEFWAKDPKTKEKRGFNLLNETTGSIRAKELLGTIANGAWADGEPGAYFIDNAHKANPFPYEIEHLRLLGPNPCLAAGTLIYDGDRLRKIEDGDGKLYTAWSNGIKHIVKLTLSNGRQLRCTPDHKILTTNGFVSANDTLGLRIIEHSESEPHIVSTHNREIVAKGFLFGDGFTSANGRGISVKINKSKEKEAFELLKEYGLKEEKHGSLYANRTSIDVYPHNGTKEKRLPEEIVLNDRDTIAAFLCGLYEANGSVVGTLYKRVTYKTISKGLAQDIQNLLSLLGIRSYITTNQAKNVRFTNGVYQCRESYDLSIGEERSLSIFESQIGFLSNHKSSKLKNRIRAKYSSPNFPTVVSIVYDGEEEVWDFKMRTGLPQNSANGIIVHNCGEATLRSHESCVLGSLNLSKFVKDGEFDYVLLQKYVELAVRFLDNVIDVSRPALEKIRKETQYTRKIGLGVMGLHDCLLMMGLPYSISKNSKTKEFIEKLFSSIEYFADEASIILAIERGEYPAFSLSLDAINGSHLKRNSCLTSIAPTGTIARICDASFGIEPVSFYKTKHNLVDIQYEEVHPLAKEYFDRGQELPLFFETAADISPEDHIEMQAIVQKYTDQACSKTILLPKSFPKENMVDLFIKAWKKGLKGFTVYRDGSRDKQPISNADITEEDIEDGVLSKERVRTDTMYGPSFKIKVPEGNVYCDIHWNDNEEVCEVMLQLGDGFTDTEKGLGNWAARIISKALQSGIEYDQIVKQGASTEFEHKSRAYPGRVFWFGTNGKKNAYRSIPEVVSDLLMQTINKLALDEDTEIIEESEDEHISLKTDSPDRCPNCGQRMIYTEGCYVCNCGYSKCG